MTAPELPLPGVPMWQLVVFQTRTAHDVQQGPAQPGSESRERPGRARAECGQVAQPAARAQLRQLRRARREAGQRARGLPAVQAQRGRRGGQRLAVHLCERARGLRVLQASLPVVHAQFCRHMV
jgi:hypothetical protein